MSSIWKNEFDGKKFVVTGAAGTLGRWLVRELVSAGAIVAASDRNSGALLQLDKEYVIVARGGLIHTTELQDARSIDSFVAAVRDKWGAPDFVIHAAGVFPAGALLETSDDDWDRIFDINLRAAFILIRGFSRLMIKRGASGAFVNVTSGAARVLRPGLIPYAVAKGGLERLTKGFALELGRYGVRVNAVEPGFMPGPGVPDEAIAAAGASTPLGRVSGPGDAPNAILFLCSSMSAFTTGATLNTDGGYPLTAAAIDVRANANNPEKIGIELSS